DTRGSDSQMCGLRAATSLIRLTRQDFTNPRPEALRYRCRRRLLQLICQKPLRSATEFRHLATLRQTKLGKPSSIPGPSALFDEITHDPLRGYEKQELVYCHRNILAVNARRGVWTGMNKIIFRNNPSSITLRI